MSDKKIYGVTVGTPIKPQVLIEKTEHAKDTDIHIKAEERTSWNAKLDSSTLEGAVNTALAKAKESGEFDGVDGTSVTVKSVSESTADGGSNIVTFSDGKTVTVKNGSKGSKGDAGSNGADGYTPQKGVDYFTEADKAEIITAVLTNFTDASEVAL